MPDVGKCHICKDTHPIKFCGVCRHWFCDACRKIYWKRGRAAIKDLVKGPTPNCCGVI